MMDVSEKLAYDDETDEQGMYIRLAFSNGLDLESKSLLKMKMDYYQLAVTSGASFEAEKDRKVEVQMMEVESSGYSSKVVPEGPGPAGIQDLLKERRLRP